MKKNVEFIMKKYLRKAIITALVFILPIYSFVGCTGNNSGPSTPSPAADSNTPGDSSGDNGSNTEIKADPSSQKTFVIGVAEAQANDETIIRREYFEKFIAPTYNVKFIFSEQLSDDTATKAFIENCIDSGADAIIDLKSLSPQMSKLCDDNGLVYVINGNPAANQELYSGDVAGFVGGVGSNNETQAHLFSGWLNEAASADGSEGFAIATGIASTGNQQHIEITEALLEALAAKYDLTYEDTIPNLTRTSNTIDVKNNKNITITLYPGSPTKETWLPGISTLLQSGKYGIFLSAGQTYNQTATVVNEVEQFFGKNIKIASIGALGQTLTTAFNTKDPFGNSSVDFVSVKSGSSLSAALFANVYNALTGYSETACNNGDGKPIFLMFESIGISSAEQLATMAGWDDKDAQIWIADKAIVDSMLAIFNPHLTGDDINEFLGTLNYETIIDLMS